MLKKLGAVVCASVTDVCASWRGRRPGSAWSPVVRKVCGKRRLVSGKEKKIGQKREMSSRRLAPDGDGSVVMRPC